MKKPSSILVVAPDEQLRRSIAFALEAEGLQVEAFSDLRTASESDARDAEFAIVDENAVLSVQDGWRRVAALPHEVVLLIDRLRGVPEHYATRAVRKPLLGRRLVDAVTRSGL